MAFDWGIQAKPSTPAPVANQPYVDQAGVVWQWNAAAQTWSKPPFLEFRRTREQVIQCSGRITAQGPFEFPRKGTLGHSWDTLYNKAFVELRNMVTGAIIARAAYMNQLELDAWFKVVVPNDGPSYLVPVQFIVYEVIDTRVRVTRWRAWNSFYSSFRGRGCYTGGSGYGRGPNIGTQAGYSNEFLARHGGIGLERRLMQYFYGLDPGASTHGLKSCWSARRGNVHKLPSTANGPVVGLLLGGGGSGPDRWEWNWGTSEWVKAAGGKYSMFTAGLINQNPCFIWRADLNSTTYSLSQPRDRIRGTGALQCEGMMAYCIRNEIDPNRVAFLIKPVGVTAMAAATNILQEEGYQMIAIGKHPERAGDSRYLNLHIHGLVEQRGDRDGFRVGNLRDTLSLCSAYARGAERAHSIDTGVLADQLCFYLKHPTTGIRSEEFPNFIQVIRRRCCIPIGFADGKS